MRGHTLRPALTGASQMVTRNLKIRKPSNLDLAIKRFVVFALPAIMIAGAFGANMVMGAFAPKPTKEEETIKATPVVVAEAIAESVSLYVTAQGEATPRTDITLTPEVSGKVVDVSPAFIKGGSFEKGDILIRIDPEQYRYRVIQAEANVAQAKSRFASEKAEAAIAQRDWQELGDGEAAPLTLREPQLAEAAAALASAQAALDEAKLQLERATVRAPFTGRVRTKLVDLGQFVSPGLSMGEVFATDVMEIALPLTDAEMGQLGLHVGFRQTDSLQGPNVTLSAVVGGETRVWNGSIARTDSEYNRETRVIFAYAEVRDPYGAAAIDGAPLASGLFVTARIVGREIENSVVVPRAALRGDDTVYVARDDDTLEIRMVTVASSDRNRAVLTSGIAAGERVITSPVRGAADGIALAVAGADNASLAELASTVY